MDEKSMKYERRHRPFHIHRHVPLEKRNMKPIHQDKPIVLWFLSSLFISAVISFLLGFFLLMFNVPFMAVLALAFITWIAVTALFLLVLRR